MLLLLLSQTTLYPPLQTLDRFDYDVTLNIPRSSLNVAGQRHPSRIALASTRLLAVPLNLTSQPCGPFVLTETTWLASTLVTIPPNFQFSFPIDTGGVAIPKEEGLLLLESSGTRRLLSQQDSYPCWTSPHDCAAYITTSLKRKLTNHYRACVLHLQASGAASSTAQASLASTYLCCRSTTTNQTSSVDSLIGA